MKEKYRLDVSEYQGRIRWSYVDTLEKIPIAFCVYSCYCWKRSERSQFNRNWLGAKDKMIRGAYHYYRPNENTEQAALLLKQYNFKGDLPPF
jgi:lysozyme